MSYAPRINFISRTGAGVVGGVVGGLVLGIVLWILDKLSLYGSLVGDETLSTSWVMILVVAGALGGVFGAFVGKFISGMIVSAIGVGLVWGMLSWVVLAMLVLPLFGEGGVFNIKDSGGIVVLGTYTLFGVVTAVVYAVAGPRRKVYWRSRRDYGVAIAMPSLRRRRRREESAEDEVLG
jgi:hypothetical protein